MFVIVSYDVQDNRRRTKIMKALKDFGQRVQYSVFECDLEQSDYLRMKSRLDQLVDAEEDSIRFYFLCAQDVVRIERIGGVQPLSKSAIFVGLDNKDGFTT